MTEYLDAVYDWSDPGLVAVCDTSPLWSARFGLLLLEHVPMGSGWQVLDVGCGMGFPLLELAQRLGPSCTVCGIDPWAAALDRARAKIERLGITNVGLIEGNAAAMPFEDARFDLIVSNLGINNFDDPPAVLAECYRVARPGGVLAMTTNPRGHMREFYEVFEATLKELGKQDRLERLADHVNHRTTLDQLCGWLAAAGFSVRHVHEETYTMRYTDGSAMLRHALIKYGFRDAWRSVLEPDEVQGVFRRLEGNLNRHADEHGELALTIPMAYVEAGKQGDPADQGESQ